MALAPASLDAVLTDPPYYGMVQYGELMHFLYIWLRKLMGGDFVGLEAHSTKHAGELTGNATEGRGIGKCNQKCPHGGTGQFPGDGTCRANPGV